ISDLTKNKKNKVYKQNILLYGKFISHLSLNQLASMYFANNSKNMAYEYYGDFSIFEKFDFPVCKENTLKTVLADTVTNLEKEKANKTIAKVSVNQRIGKFAKKLLNDWNSFFYETEIDTI
ncbi:MAG: hypothetical protein GX879_08140, partial [Bacteroidales bacterium]|nr:hypothetical protein [Bacteroidales bacterium]